MHPELVDLIDRLVQGDRFDHARRSASRDSRQRGHAASSALVTANARVAA